ncbi:hypothetical protein [Enterobacter huaxiensis]|uniref:Uncharacterized protein n=1 Tax=Enterobacter huaxiensis TaxID=2494702 RepID=A0ABU6EPU3_9ENTR|nr:hypothetical protein [Enterobacter huaxiensis]MEB7543064.1 hypothetical protein [Enterobacter huaxiensis]MEB7582268.1 hypothetical protein [Enterobacter huaxiensis]MEB7664535.1 hypothetical protein [Enterobacter huaxiensis]
MLYLLYGGNVRASTIPVAERVIQHGFPTQPAALAEVTQSLFQEYSRSDNPLSLVFYAYGMLRQADYFLTASDLIRASEYAKTGFFYLDEAVELHEDDPKIRYLRARVDAWLASDLGRCVITLNDTALMLNNAQGFSVGLVEHIKGMRYRALLSCKRSQQAKRLLSEIKKQDPDAAAALESGSAPEWDMTEVTQIVLPLVKGK